MELEERLRQVFIAALELKAGTEPAVLRVRESPEWDSLAHMGLIMAIEDEFGLELTADQVIELDSYDAALLIVTAAVSPA